MPDQWEESWEPDAETGRFVRAICLACKEIDPDSGVIEVDSDSHENAVATLTNMKASHVH